MGGRDLPTFDWICHNANATGPFIIIIIIFTPVLNSQGMKKLRYKKIQKSSWNEPYSSLLLLHHETVMQYDGIVPLNQNGESLK